MTNLPDVSIIILNFNKSDLTFDCVRSVIDKTKEVSYEIIVVDNASTIGTIDEIESLSPAVRLIKSEVNLGFAKGNNLGIQYCRGNSVLLLNNDTTLINDAVSITYKKLYENSKTGVVGAQLLYPDGEIQKSAQRLPEIRYLLFELFRLQKLMPASKAGKLLLGSFFDHRQEVKCGWIWGTYFHFKREILEKLPMKKLADDFFMYNEDMQWGIEIARAGYLIIYCADAKVYHFEGKNKFKTQMAVDHFSVIMKRYYGVLYFRLYRLIQRLVRLTNVGS